MTTELKGRRVLIVGASSGIGRAVAPELSRLGADVALVGRRAELLASAAEDCPGRAVWCAADVRSPTACKQAIAETVSRLGGLDVLIYCAAKVVLCRVAEATPDDWYSTFETNVIGASLCTQAAITHLEQAAGHCIYVSSSSILARPPWAGNGVYSTSKLALEACIRSWRAEHPAVAFTILRVGPTAGEYSVKAERAAEFGSLWRERRHITDRRLDPSEHARAIAGVLTSPGYIEEVTVGPR